MMPVPKPTTSAERGSPPMYEERQQRLQAHVAKRRRRVAGVRDALDVEPPESGLARGLLEDRDRAAGALLVEQESTATPLREQGGEPVARRERGQGRDHEHDRGRQLVAPRSRRPPLRTAIPASTAPAAASAPIERTSPSHGTGRSR